MKSIYAIPVFNLILIFIPVLAVIALHYRWQARARTPVYATFRMTLQLVIIGFVLVAIFENRQPGAILLILCFMLATAAWIALRPIPSLRGRLYWKSLAALSLATLSVLVLVIGGVIRLKPWYEPRYLLPLAGMLFANAMNCLSLSAERFHAEKERGASYVDARNTAFHAGLVPLTNSFFAVGLVSLPGMMTGQILAGVDPLMAVRYQIMVMCMLYGASGIASAVFLAWARDDFAEKTT